MSKLSSKVDERPAMQFYLKDWLADTRILNLAERGLWIDALAFMWRSPQRGKLLMQNGCKPDAEAMRNLFGTQDGEAETVIDRLVAKGVASRDRNGVIYCRRMVRENTAEEAISDARRKAAKARWECKTHAKDALPTPDSGLRSPTPTPNSKGLGLGDCADESDSSAPPSAESSSTPPDTDRTPTGAGKRKRRYSDEERAKIDKNVAWFYGRYFKAVGSHSPQEPKPGRFPHPADARAALKLSGLLTEHKPDRVDAMLRDWLAGKYLSVPGDTLACFVAVFGKLLNPASRKREWVNETPGAERSRSSGSGGFKRVGELLPPEARNV